MSVFITSPVLNLPRKLILERSKSEMDLTSTIESPLLKNPAESAIETITSLQRKEDGGSFVVAFRPSMLTIRCCCCTSMDDELVQSPTTGFKPVYISPNPIKISKSPTYSDLLKQIKYKH
jgi:hypothetical protein